MHGRLPTLIRAGLFLLLVIFTTVAVLITWQNSRTLHTFAEQSLENTALALASAAERSLHMQEMDKAAGEIRQILSDRVVAYALIASPDGAILFHTNPRLVGTRLTGGIFDKTLLAPRPVGHRITLGTGLPAYQYDYLLQYPDPASPVLRLVINTADSDEILAQAGRMWWALAAMLVLLWILGVLFERISLRNIRLQTEMERQRRLGMIGQMTSVLAHEIRNALGSVKGSVQFADERIPESDELKPALSLAVQGSLRIETLVNDLLTYSREERYHLGPVDPAALMREAAGHALGDWPGEPVLPEDGAGPVLADREKLLRVFINALRNAREAGGEQGVITVTITARRRMFVLDIADSGPGMTPEAIEHLFEPFFTTKTTGTGLGLAYAKKVVEGMHGAIELINNDLGPGAVLRIILPAAGKEQHG